MSLRRRRVVPILLIAVTSLLGSCDYLRDKEPFTVTIQYAEGPAGGVVVTPPEFYADAAFGEVQVVNDTEQDHGFAIRELGVFEKILKKKTRTVEVEEARDGRTYTFYCHIHDDNEINGKMIVKYLSEEERG